MITIQNNLIGYCLLHNNKTPTTSHLIIYYCIFVNYSLESCLATHHKANAYKSTRIPRLSILVLFETRWVMIMILVAPFYCHIQSYTMANILIFGAWDPDARHKYAYTLQFSMEVKMVADCTLLLLKCISSCIRS